MIFTTEKTNKRRNTTTVLKQITSDLSYGILSKKANHPVHCNKNKECIRYLDSVFASKKHGIPCFNRRPSSLSVDDFNRHNKSEQTFYFTGSAKDRYCLIMPEIDVMKANKKGSPEGAKEFSEFLKNEEEIFQQKNQKLYCEPSTNGKGIHSYFILDKGQADAKSVKKTMKLLEEYLNYQAKLKNADIEMVEVKGLPPVIEWNNHGVESYTAGTLAKLPRLSNEEKDEQFRNTLIIPILRIQTFLHDWKEKQKKKERKIQKIGKKLIIVPPAMGSIYGKHITPEMIANLPNYKKMAKLLLENTEIETFGVSRTEVNKDDVAIFIMIGQFFSLNMNEDGSMPTARWREMWRSLFECGDVGRQFNENRFVAIRNWFTSMNFIDWKSSSYIPPRYYTDKNGNKQKIKGKACKWCFSDVIMSLLTEENTLSGKKSILDYNNKQISKIQENQLHFKDIEKPKIKEEIRLSPDFISDLIPEYSFAA